MNKHVIACAIGFSAIAQAQANIITTNVPGGTMSVNVPDTYSPVFTAGQVHASPGVPSSAGVSQASANNGAIQLTFANGYSSSAPVNPYGVWTQYDANVYLTTRGTPSITMPVTFSSQAASTAGYAVDFFGSAGGSYNFNDGVYEIDYSFKVTATDASGQTQTLLDTITKAQNGTDISSLSSGLLATAIIPQGFDLNSVQAQFDITAKTLKDPTSTRGQAYGSYLIGVTNVVLRPTSTVPESGTAALMLIGLSGLVATMRRRGTQQHRH